MHCTCTINREEYVIQIERKEELINSSDPSSGLTGIEPAASALTGRCSDQLNYNPGEVYSIHIACFRFFIVTEIQTICICIISTWIFLVRVSQITSHLVVLFLSRGWEWINKKKEGIRSDFFKDTYRKDIYRILRNHESRSLERWTKMG